MIQVVYEYAADWPEDGPLQVNVPPLSAEITVSPDAARRRANGYLTCDVAMAFRPGNPTLILRNRPVWRMPVYLHLRGVGQVARLGSIEVDANTREVIPLSPAQIAKMQEQANDLAIRLSPQPEPAV